jgi:hypothetical protein
MITELAISLDDFPGPANQTRCFTHVLNLVVKSIIKQFDLPKAQADKALDDAAEELLKLAGNIEREEEIFAEDGDDGEKGEDDNEEGWIDEREEMNDVELDELDACVLPIRMLLTKVREFNHTRTVLTSDTQLRKAAFLIKNSTTIILPKWFSILEELALNPRMMPRDVRTRWNSTFDMLNFAVEHRDALDTITGDRDMKLRQYELSEEDWATATELRDVLKASLII